ncbi:MAG: exodeoxyribonuclease VII small subunit [Ruminiclostridium sp.]|nr:exodeoxyribonuclease VII small subunit [Ruminiclostridium sp.]
MKFEEAYKRLGEISEEMEDKDLPLEKAVALYSEAAKLVEICKKDIEAAKLEIERIDNGGAV